MKKIVALNLERTGETKQYYIFKLRSVETIPQFFPKDKIYLRKDYFVKEPMAVILTITEKEK